MKAARRSSSVGGAWPALAFCRSLRASIESCMAWLGMSASPLSSAARLTRREWRFGGRPRTPTVRPISPDNHPCNLWRPRCCTSAAESYGARRPSRRAPRRGPAFISTYVRPGFGHCEPGNGTTPRTPADDRRVARPTCRATRHRRPLSTRPPSPGPIRADSEGLEGSCSLSASSARGVLAQHAPRRRCPH